jgi:hypothetical protein
MKERAGELARLITSHSTHIDNVFNNQERLRKNLHSMEKMLDSPLVLRYLEDLNKEEDDLNKTRQGL